MLEFDTLHQSVLFIYLCCVCQVKALEMTVVVKKRNPEEKLYIFELIHFYIYF